MNYLTLAFFMGFLGSFHCAVMCGPLVLALPTAGMSQGKAFFNKLLYQFGRLTTYGTLGLIIGFIGNAVAVQGWQQGISLFTGVLLVTMAVFTFMGNNFPALILKQQQFMAPLISRMGYWLYRPGGNVFAGMLNGLLPCGMVYMALAAALNADSAWSGGTFMLVFGAGTLPMMLLVSVFGNFVKRYFNFNMAKWLPAMFLIMGCWFLLRGANLDIPYLSPLIYPEGAINCK